MDFVVGQQPFRMEHRICQYFGGEQCLETIDSLYTIQDDKKHYFVFVRNKEGRLYYFIQQRESRIEYCTIDTGLFGSSHLVTKDEKGRVLVLCARGNELHFIRQQVYQPTLFEAPILALQSKAKIMNIACTLIDGILCIALVLKRKEQLELQFGYYHKEFLFEEKTYPIHAQELQWINIKGQQYLEVMDDVCLERFQVDLCDIHSIGFRKIQIMHCPSRFPWMASLEIEQRAKVNQILARLPQIIQYDWTQSGSKIHILLVVEEGFVYQLTIDEEDVTYQKLDLSEIKQICFRAVDSLHAYAIDASGKLLYELNYVLPSGKWKIKPVVLYYQQNYRIQFTQALRKPQIAIDWKIPFLPLQAMAEQRTYLA